MQVKTHFLMLCGVAGLLVIGALGIYFLMPNSPPTIAADKKPLYWVAPMDANYKRDAPGKSPMGMDLVPVYADAATTVEPGTISISPDIINNLGVRTTEVKKMVLQQTLKTLGNVQYNQDKLVHIHPRVEGWIDTLYVKATGDTIAKGQPLYALYSPQLVNVQEEYLLALSRNNERLLSATEDRLRALKLSPEFIAQLKINKKIKPTITFYAAQSGVVDNLNIREGFFVQPGTTLMSIGNLDDVWVEAEVFERQALWVKPNMPVTLTLDYLPGRVWQSHVEYIYPMLDPKTRTLRVRILVDNDDKVLKPNMFAELELREPEANLTTKVLAVPNSAVIRTGEQERVVLALGGGRFKSIAVSTGRRTQEYTEITSGLNEGDSIVISAQFLLDSESSKTSDFKRLHHGEQIINRQNTPAIIKSINIQQHQLTLQHEAIAAWGWPAMTMDFVVADDINVGAFVASQAVVVEITQNSNNHYVITHIRAVDSPAGNTWPSASATGVVLALNSHARTLTIARGPIAKWNRPAATVEFIVDPNIAIDAVNINTQIAFDFDVREGDFVITKIEGLPLNAHDVNEHKGGDHD